MANVQGGGSTTGGSTTGGSTTAGADAVVAAASAGSSTMNQKMPLRHLCPPSDRTSSRLYAPALAGLTVASMSIIVRPASVDNETGGYSTWSPVRPKRASSPFERLAL